MVDEVVAGQVLAGKFRVERVLGQGGMGLVVLAHHLQLDERVAIKFMLPEGLANPETLARFAREARAAVKIKSEHVARVSDVGTLDNGAPYMVMEYLEGGDLAHWLRQHGPLPSEQAVEFLLQASEAIAEAHSLGIVHRDLKPANLFVIQRPDGALSVKVLDFGISKVTGTASSAPDFGMTKTSAVLGSPFYMSPEQMRSAKEADSRSDIWALGVILYELLSGVTPFTADALPELVLRVTSERPTPIRTRAPAVQPRLEAVILRCLAKDPNERFQSIADLAEALAEFAPARSRISLERIAGIMKRSGSGLALPVSSAGARSEDGTRASWGQTASARGSPGKRAVLATVALLSLGLVGLAGYAARARATRVEPTAEPSTAAGSVALPPSSTQRPMPGMVVAPTVSVEPAPEPPAVVAPSVSAARSALPLSPKRAPPSAVPARASAVGAPPPIAKPKPMDPRQNTVFDDR